MNDEKTLSYLSRLDNGFSCSNQPTKQIGRLKLKEGKLSEDAQKAEHELKAYTLAELGKPLAPVVNI